MVEFVTATLWGTGEHLIEAVRFSIFESVPVSERMAAYFKLFVQLVCLKWCNSFMVGAVYLHNSKLGAGQRNAMYTRLNQIALAHEVAKKNRTPAISSTTQPPHTAATP